MENLNASQEVVSATLLRASLKSQYHAGLAMLRIAIDQSPRDLWVDPSHTNPTWRIAYHAIYYTHLYLQPQASDFRAWGLHQTDVQYLDSVPAPPEIEAVVEPAERKAMTGVPYTKAEILDYWRLCDAMIDSAVEAIDLTAPTSGFDWYPIPKIEHQMVNLRHLMHHTGQLYDRVRKASGEGVDWVGRDKR